MQATLVLASKKSNAPQTGPKNLREGYVDSESQPWFCPIHGEAMAVYKTRGRVRYTRCPCTGCEQRGQFAARPHGQGD